MAKSKPQSNEIKVVTKDDPNIVTMVGNAHAHMVMAENYVIDSPEMFEIAAQTLSEIRSAEKLVEEERLKIADPLHKAWKNTNALFKPIADALGSAKNGLGRKMVAYENAEKAKVRAAEQIAEEQRRRDIAAAEAAEAETRAKFAEGKATTVEVVEATAAVMMAEVATPIVHAAAPASRAGHARRESWVVEEITSMPALLQFLAAKLYAGDPTFNNTVEIKLGQLNAFAQSTSGSVPIPGVTFTKKETIIARGA